MLIVFPVITGAVNFAMFSIDIPLLRYIQFSAHTIYVKLYTGLTQACPKYLQYTVNIDRVVPMLVVHCT